MGAHTQCQLSALKHLMTLILPRTQSDHKNSILPWHWENRYWVQSLERSLAERPFGGKSNCLILELQKPSSQRGRDSTGVTQHVNCRCGI